MARGSSDQSAGSWWPIASRRMPSRSAHSLTSSRRTRTAPSRWRGTSTPAGDEVDPAGLEARRSAAARRPWSRGSARAAARNSSRVNVSWLSDRGTSSSRRAAAMWARSSSVPLLPDHQLAARAARPRRRSGPSTSTRWSRSACRSPFESGSLCTNSAVSRPTPRFSLVAHRSPAASPTMISTLPPPRSKHERRRGLEQHAGRGRRRRSARPRARPLITSTVDARSRPRCGRRRSSPFAAGADRARRAGRDLVAPAASASSVNRRTVATAASAASVGDAAVAAHDVAEAEHLLLAASGSKLPSGWTSAISRWNEFVPRSSAAIRTVRSVASRSRRPALERA